MAKAYLFGEIEITDQAEFDRYRAAVPATIEAYGGRYVVRGGDPELIEGEPNSKLRTVLLEFPSREKLMEWYSSAEYSGPKAMRFRSAKTRVWVMTGLDS
jgi:uncharacterized protein (DUF1330 family)